MSGPRVAARLGRPAGKRRSPFIKYGLPFVLLCVAGYYGLSKFVTGKYDAIDSRVKKRSERSAQLEAEHKKIMSKLATEEFVLRPVPPPREDDSGLR